MANLKSVHVPRGYEGLHCEVLPDHRYQHVRVGDQEYQIPESWLLGRQLVHARAGLRYLAAYREAVADWIVQAELERSVSSTGLHTGHSEIDL